jgi:hypothetical protein
MIGAPLGAIIGVSLISLPGNLSALARESGVTFFNLVRPLWPWFYRFALFLTGVWFVTRVFVPVTFLTIGLTTVVVAMGYALVMLPLILRDPLGAYVRPRIKAVELMFRRKPLVQDADV